MRLEIAERAETDLEEIGDHIAEDNPLAADRLVDAIERKFVAIARQPLLFAPQDEVVTGFRRAPVGAYSIWFRIVDTESVRIERIVHSARDLPSLFDTEG